ncbi:phosphatase PAP2 family protein [Desulfolithobacter sp.]
MRKKKALILTAASMAWLLSVIPASAGDEIELAGDILQVLLPLTAGGMTLYKEDRKGTAQFAKAFISTLGATYALKYSIDEERPNGDSRSFPSLHTSISFAGASFLQTRYGWRYGAPAYMAASFVGLSRIEADEHYLHDVLAGAVIGIASSRIFADAWREGVVITPYAGKKSFGVSLSARF